MSHAWRVALTIARRDYGATVFSRMFLLFLIGPLFPLVFVGLFGAIGGGGGDPPAPRAVVAVSGDLAPLQAARVRLTARLGDEAAPLLVAKRQAPVPGQVATLAGGIDAPRLRIAADAPGGLADQVSLLVDDARAVRALGDRAPPRVTVTATRIAAAAKPDRQDRIGLAKIAQTVMFTLTILLAGMLLSNLIEEKSNKVIEVLAAAVPIDAIFLGKLIGMLAISFTGIAVWGVTAVVGLAVIEPGAIGAIPVPAVGWPLFVALGFAYFATSYLLLGAVFLSLGGHATSPREVQTLSMPVTMVQLLLFGFASADVGRPDHWVAKAAAIFPWSSPLAMLARAAEQGALWPHLAALVWQAAWPALAVRFTAARFRRAVLKSGPARKRSSSSSRT